VQTVFMVGKDALKLTTAKYFTPSGRCIHKDRPRNEEEQIEAAAQEEKDKTNAEPRKEFHTAGGRTVYGSGGITPDWEVTLPAFTNFERDLELRGTFFNFAVHYTAFHKVKDNFEVTDAVVSEFRKYLADNKFAANDSVWTPENTDYARLAIKREVFRKLMGTKGAYLATLAKDDEVNKVLAMFGAGPTLEQMFAYVNKQTKAAEAAKK